jgi:hypothetical protein
LSITSGLEKLRRVLLELKEKLNDKLKLQVQISVDGYVTGPIEQNKIELWESQ